MTGIVNETSGLPSVDVIPEGRFTRLRRYNVVMGVLHGVQAVAVVALATSFALPVTAAFMTGPPGSKPAAPATLFDVSIAWGCALFGVNVSMILFGLLQEKNEKPGGGMLPFWLGCIAGVTPWIAIGIYLVSPGNAANPPGFVYGIFISLFVCFNCFALNQWLQYRRIRKWSDYLHGESVYITLSLVAKSLLAWQVSAGTLAPAS